MSKKNVSRSGHEVVDKVVDKRIRAARQEEVLGIYEELLQAVWDRILPTLGRVTTMAIMERAIILTNETYPTIEQLEVDTNGLRLQKLRESIVDLDPDIIREAMKELVADLIDILAMLTGDILVKQLIKEIEEGR